MNQIDLEIILEKHASYGTGETVRLPIAVHVHKYLEQFIYVNSIRDAAIPIAYLGNEPTDSWKNLVIVNKSHCVIANSPRLLPREKKLDSTVSTAYSSSYADILATDVVVTDSAGKENPLFYRHRLPSGCTDANVYSVKNGNKNQVLEGYLIDLETTSIYTNYQNYFDPDSGSYVFYYVTSTASDGTTQNTLLNPEPATKEATWEDIDLVTGMLNTSYPLYTKERAGRGYTFYFNKGTRWFIKPQERGLIQPRRPQSKRPDSPWYIRFSAGDVSDLVSGVSHRYSIPEFATQPFIPYSPIKFGSKEDMLVASRRVLAASRKTLNINPALGLHIEIYGEDEEGNLKVVYTTDQSLDNTRYSNTDVFYSSNKISSWDNEFGFIAMAVDLFPNYTYWARYYYKADDYEYMLVNLNPITNKKLKDHTYVFYLIPDVDTSDRAIHYLLIDSDGRIVETSQNLGIGHPNLQLRNLDGSHNTSTVINMLYFSETESCFLTQYGAGFNNTQGYMILAEITGLDSAIEEDQVVIDVRRPGGVIKPSEFTTAIRANPRILQSHLGYGTQGQIVPEAKVVVIEPPLSILEDYGGLMTPSQAEKALRTHMPVDGYAVINWVYPKTEVTATSYTITGVSLSLTWEGEYNYLIYRRASSSDQWTLIHTESSPAFGSISFVDTGLISGSVYQYAASIVDGDIEYPLSDILTIKVR